jgi:hypothetical protein
VRLGKRYGSERLEAACARALAINNPTRKSVEAILKSGLEKVALTEEAEAKPVIHENIRGGDYFDRGEVEAISSNEIDLRYLEEERFAIMNEPCIEPSRGPAQRNRVERTQEMLHRAAGGAVGPALDADPPPTTKTLQALLERLQIVWTRPRTPEPGRCRAYGDRSNKSYYHRVELTCTSTGECLTSIDSNDGIIGAGEQQR